MTLVDELMETSADFEVALREVSDGRDGAVSYTGDAYGRMIKAKGRLVRYIAALMDALPPDHEATARRSVQVRF